MSMRKPHTQATKLILLILTGLLLTACASFSPNRPEPPIVNLSNIKMLDATAFEQRYAVELRVQNPNDYELPLRGIKYNLAINGVKLTNGVSPAELKLPAYGEGKMQFEASINLFSALNQLSTILDIGNKPLSYNLSGKIGVVDKTFQLPFTQKGQLNQTKDTLIPKLFFKKL